MKFSVKYALIICFLVVIWGTQIIITSTSYLTSQKVLLRHSKDIMENITGFAMEQSHNHLALAEGATHLTKRLLTSNVVKGSRENLEILEQYFFNQLLIYPHFAGIYLGTKEGDFFYVSRNETHSKGGFRTKNIIRSGDKFENTYIWRDKDQKIVLKEDKPEDTYDPRTRPWFNKALDKRRIVWTDPYIFYTSQRPGITIAGLTFNRNRTIKGVVGVDIDIAQLSTFIAKLKVGKNGKAFIINNNGDVVAFPDPEKIKIRKKDSLRLANINEINDEISKKAFNSVNWKKDYTDRYILKKSRFGKFEHKGKDYNVMFTPFQSQWPWIIGVYLPEDDYLGEIKDNRLVNILIAILLSILATVFALKLTKEIDRPLTNLEREAEAVQRHDLLTDFDTNSVFKEIQATADSFTAMRKSLYTHEVEKSKLEQQLRSVQKLEAIGTLAGGIAHDFNNILSVILGHAEIIQCDIERDDPSAESINEILKSSQRARNLIKQILTFSRKNEQELLPVNAAKIVNDALSLIRSTIPSTVLIKEKIDKTTGTVLADPTQIYQIVLNLCTNSNHAMTDKNDGILEVIVNRVDISKEVARVNSELSEGPYLKLSVIDNGSGMDKDMIERIFEPYFTTKSMEIGTGLGLAIVHGIVKSHGGFITVESELNRGTVFEVLLPIIEGEALYLEKERAELIEGSEHIFLVDDDKALIDVSRKMLQKLGYQVTSNRKPEEALEIFRENPDAYDAVILNLTMPVMKGDILAENISGINPAIPIVLCTGKNENLDLDGMKQSGIKEILYKPITLSELSSMIRKVLS
ncbi:MAG: response regulator [Deltaproteobacteria bacterium]|nr:response regulator [Deltaproteobacteria bacterium]